MNIERTNETLKISELISMAMFSATAELSRQTHEGVSQLTKNISSKVEGGDPVRSAERVPYSSSHQFAYHQPIRSGDNCGGTERGVANVAAA